VVLAGRRAIALEVQALVVQSEGPPRRQVDGMNARRFHILAAVTDQAAGLGLIRAELYASVAGGFQLADPGADLAVSVALASSATGKPARDGTVFIGEVSLTGAVRPVGGLEQRAAAAAAAGARTVVCAASERDVGPAAGSLHFLKVRHVREALRVLASSGVGGSGGRRTG
jgi:DNA repair protein RadA/Sms